MESVSCWFPAPGCRWPAWSSSPGSSSSSCSPTAPTSPIRRYPTVSSTRAASTVYTGDDVRDGPEGLPAPRPHGVRLDLRPRRLPRARTSPPTTCTAPRHRCAISSAARGSDSARQETIDQFQTNRYDSDTKTLPLIGPAGARVRPAASGTTRDFFDSPTTRYGLRPRPIDDPEQIHQLTAFFAWSSLGGIDPAPGPQLLLHEQLAARGAGREHAERRRPRLVGDLADRAARRHRDPVRGLRALEAGLAGARAGDAQLPLARRRGADSRPAGHRLVLLRDGGAVPAPDPGRRAPRSTTAPSSTASSASTSPRCSPTTWSAPGTCSWRSSSSPPRSSPPASSWRR